MPERATKGPRRLGAVLEHGAAWEEPRVERARARALLAMGRSARGGVSCGAERWGESAEFGRIEAEWFAWFVERPHGIPFPFPDGHSPRQRATLRG